MATALVPRACARSAADPRPARATWPTTAWPSSTWPASTWADPERLEAELETIPGVVECGIFARRRADVVLAGSEAGVRTIRAWS